MKTNQLRTKRISILFSLAVLLLISFISNAQIAVDVNGKTGVGIAAPTTKLHIADNSHVELRLSPGNAGDGTADATFRMTGQSNNTSEGFEIKYDNDQGDVYLKQISTGVTGSNPAFRFQTGNTTNAMVISGGGNIGMGTPSPGNTLTVQKDAGGGALAYFNSQNSTSGYGIAINTAANNAATYALHLFRGGNQANSILWAGTNGNVGIGTNAPGIYKLNVNGTTACSGNAWTSDQLFKTNVDSISNALALINQLKPRSYYFDTTNIYGMNFNNLKQYGLIAQDVEQILPELVTSTTKPADVDTLGNVIHPAVTYKSLNYNAFTAIMLQGIKEQSSKMDSLSEGLNAEKEKTNNQDSIIASLQNQLNALASLINSCCNDHHDNGNHNGNREAISNQTNIELNDAQSVVLQQNVPNPFSEQTSINYSLPDNTVKAQMLFYNAQGKLIQSTELTQKGKGTLRVFANDLSNGIYTYTLVVDGKIIESKKMMKQ